MKRAGYAAFFLGIALLTLLMLRANWAVLLHALASLGAVGLLLMVGFHLPVIASAGVAWWYFGRDAPGATVGGFVRARLVRDSVAVTLPFSQVGGFVAGIRALAASGVPALDCGLSMLADLIAEFASLFPYLAMGLTALFLLAPGSALLRPLAIGALAVAALAVVAFTVRRGVARALLVSIRTIVCRFTGTAPETFRGFDRAFFRVMLAPRPLAANLSLHFGRWAIGAVETWVAFHLMGVQISLGNALIVDSIVAGLRIFAFMVPAAIGVQEGFYVLVCGIVGLPPAIALAFAFVWRARDTLIGLIGLAVWHAVESSAQAKRSAGASQAQTTLC